VNEDSTVELKFCNFRHHARKARRAGEELVAETAQAIEDQVSARWIRTKVPVRQRGKGLLIKVVAGKKSRYYAVFLEYGTLDQNPQPAMVPAAERARKRFLDEARRIERKMQY
jgi:hypothetical protein